MNHTIHHTTNLDAASGIARRRRTRVLAVPAIAAAAFVATGVPAAAESPAVTCGSVVTDDIRLTHDLVDCPGAGLIVGASGVTVDLGGHTIDGSGTGAGIDNGAGHDDLDIVNGTVREFVFGIHLFETRGASISDLSAEANLDGLKIERSSGVTIDATTVRDNVVTGIEVTFSDGVTVRASSASGSLLGGIVDRFSTATTIEGSTFSGNVGPGITVDGTDGATIRRNDVSGNDSDGIVVSFLERGSIDRNTSTANSGSGIVIDHADARLTRNDTSGNGGFGIVVTGASSVDARRNTSSGNAAGGCAGVTCS
jgi:parallel beta-helix repeat protein